MSASQQATLWYVGRGSGVVSLLLLTVVMVLGIGSRSGRPVFGLPRFAVVALHRSAGLMAVVFLAIHVLTLWLDPLAGLRVIDTVLPFAASYQPFWMGLGTIGLDVMVAVVVTSLLRQRLGGRAWRAVHWLAYLSWPVAVLHTVGAGTDRSTWWLLGLTALSIGIVAAAVLWRLTDGFGQPSPQHLPSPVSGSSGVPMEVAR